MRANASSGQAAITCSASGKRSGWRTASAGRTRRAPAGRAREPAERRGVVDRAEDHEPRRRRGTSTNRVTPSTRTRALGPHQLLGASRAGRSSARPRALPLRRPRPDQQLGADRRPGDHADQRARPSSARMRANSPWRLIPRSSSTTRRSRRRTAARRPRPPSRRSRSAGARLALAQHLGGDLDDRALDAAARHRPRHLAVLVDGHLGARRARGGTLDRHHGGDRDALPRLGPRPYVIDDVLHAPSSLPQPSHRQSIQRFRQLLQRGQRVGRHELVHVRQRRPHPARQRLVVGVRLQRVEPDQPVRAAPRRAISRSSWSGSPRSQPSESSTTTAPRPSRRPCSRLSVASASLDPGAARPVARGVRARAPAPLGVAPAQLRGHASAACRTRTPRPASGRHAGLHVGEQHARVGLHRAGHVADQHERPRALAGLAPVRRSNGSPAVRIEARIVPRRSSRARRRGPAAGAGRVRVSAGRADRLGEPAHQAPRAPALLVGVVGEVLVAQQLHVRPGRGHDLRVALQLGRRSRPARPRAAARAGHLVERRRPAARGGARVGTTRRRRRRTPAGPRGASRA